LESFAPEREVRVKVDLLIPKHDWKVVIWEGGQEHPAG
jgi:hypothetical protein